MFLSLIKLVNVCTPHSSHIILLVATLQDGKEGNYNNGKSEESAYGLQIKYQDGNKNHNGNNGKSEESAYGLQIKCINSSTPINE